RAQVTRRAALFISLFAEQGAPLGEAAAETTASPEASGTAGPLTGAAPPRRDGSRPGDLAAPRGPPAPARWASSAQLGLAFAPGDGGVSPAEALTLRARRYLWPGVALELGAKLSGQYDAEVAGQSVALADRSLFAGLAYEAWLSRWLAVDLGGAIQYTYPLVDVDAGPVTRLEAPASTRLAVRTGVGLVFVPADHLTVSVSATTSFSFREREYTDGTGREVLDLGAMILDVAAGAGVRW
ncbi:MAG TPA: hypothetical protein VIW03_01175, partial [Anaeromyxobacter sp.]